MPIAAGISAVGAVASGAIGASAASSAANTQASAARYSADQQKAMFDQVQQLLAPFRQAGLAGQSQLATLLGQGSPTQTVKGTPGTSADYLKNNPDVEASYNQLTSGTADPAAQAWFKSLPPEAQQSLNGFADFHQQTFGGPESRVTGGTADTTTPTPGFGSLLQNNKFSLPTSNFSPTPFAPFNPGDLSKTPGYQFTLDQGLKSVKNAFSARGLGDSGALGKGLIDYATGKADSTYNEQLQNYLTQQQQGYNQGLTAQQNQFNQDLSKQQATFGQDFNQRQLIGNLLTGQQSVGLNAATGTGNAGLTSQSAINNLLVGGANATAAGQVGSANAITGGISGIGSSILLNKLLGVGGNTPSPLLTGGNNATLNSLTDPAYLGA